MTLDEARPGTLCTTRHHPKLYGPCVVMGSAGLHGLLDVWSTKLGHTFITTPEGLVRLNEKAPEGKQ